MTEEIECRQILSLSGGKDSTALAVYMRDRVPDMDYVFCDTAEELPETYEYLDRLEAFLGKSIIRLNPDRPFKHYLEVYRGVLPDARTRWCTRMLKLRPFEDYVGDEPVVNYIGIRADENRQGYISHRPNIKPKYPFVEDGITKDDVIRILEDAGLGLPDYYKWRSRSGCYFCFFQQRIEWVGLLENHPDKYEEAKKFEKLDDVSGKSYSWSQKETLDELAHPDRVAQIKAEHAARVARKGKSTANRPLGEVLDEVSDDSDTPCLICHL